MDQAFGKPAGKLDPAEREARINLVTSLLAGLAATLDPQAVAAVNEAARLELENNQFALPMPGGGGGLLGGVSRGAGSGGRETIRQQLGLDPKDEVSPEENIKWQPSRWWNSLFGADDRVSEVAGVPGLPAVLPGDPVAPIGLPPKEGVGNIPNTQFPGQPGQALNVGGVRGKENNGVHGGTTTSSPLPEEQPPGLIFKKPDDVLKPNGQFVGYVNKGATPNIRTVSLNEFDKLKTDLLTGASPAGTYAGGKGTWYDLPAGGGGVSASGFPIIRNRLWILIFRVIQRF